MAILTHTVTGNIADLLGANYSKVMVDVYTNLPDGAVLVDQEHNTVLAGHGLVTVTNGVVTIPGLIDPASPDVNVVGIQYRFVFRFADTVTRKLSSLDLGWYSITADTTFGDLVAGAYEPPDFQSEFLTEAQAILAQQEVISGLTGEDDAVALLVNTPSSDTASALAASIGEQIDTTAERRLTRRAGVVNLNRKVLTVDGREFYIRGVNLGICAGNFYDSWVDDWDQAVYFTALENMARSGFNTVRIAGMCRAYLDGPAQYKARLHSLFEKARELDLKVIYEFLNGAAGSGGGLTDRLNWGVYEADYKAMFADLTDGYVGDPLVLVWGVGNELHAAGSDPAVPGFLEIIENFAPWIKTQDPATFVTASQAISGDYDEAFAKMDAVEDYVDLQALHIYLAASTTNWGAGAIQAWVNHTSLPLFINEVGANAATTAGGPHVGGPLAQAAFMAMVRRHAVDADVNGWIWWKAFDTAASGAVMGLWDVNGDPTPQLDQAMRFPDRRLTAVRDAIERRLHPIVLDTFDRAASTTVVGASPLGAVTPTQEVGTWGIRNAVGGGLYVSTKNLSAADKIIWDCKTRRTTWFEAEYTAVTNLADLFLYCNWTDTNQYISMRFFRGTPTTNHVVTISKVYSGSATVLATNTLVDLADSDYSKRVRLAMRTIYDGTKLWAYPFVSGIPLPRVDITPDGSTVPAITSKRGVGISSADSASYILAVRDYMEGRVAV